jgi:hypothetical protein
MVLLLRFSFRADLSLYPKGLNRGERVDLGYFFGKGVRMDVLFMWVSDY